MYPHALVDAAVLLDPPAAVTAVELAAYRAAPPARNVAPDALFAGPPARLCGTLVGLRDYANAAYPKRDRTSDGWIGDAAHSARESQHNPDVYGVVTALDLDADGLPLPAWFELIRVAVLAGKLPSLVGGYLIHNRRITTADFRGWHAYNGANPHVLHGHVSASPDRARYDLPAPWAAVLGSKPATPTPAAGNGAGTGFRAAYGQTSPAVARLQTFLRVTFPAYAKTLPSTGFYGDQTTAVVREFARRCSIDDADGRNVGPLIAAALTRYGFRG